MNAKTQNRIMSSMHDMVNQMDLTDNVAKDFALMMKIHHQGAIEMSQEELNHGSDEDLKRMAKKIIEDQNREIEELNSWLSKNKKPH